MINIFSKLYFWRCVVDFTQYSKNMNFQILDELVQGYTSYFFWKTKTCLKIKAREKKIYFEECTFINSKCNIFVFLFFFCCWGWKMKGQLHGLCLKQHANEAGWLSTRRAKNVYATALRCEYFTFCGDDLVEG